MTYFPELPPDTIITMTIRRQLQTRNQQPRKRGYQEFFIQDEITFTEKQKLLLGMRYDYNSIHGSILTPRIAYKWKLNDNNIILNAGTGFRVVNLFTEDHAALTGAREIIIANNLKPEQSINANLNYIKKINFDNGTLLH
jgi:outer membrane receptor for ferrienterochelin and colicins